MSLYRYNWKNTKKRKTLFGKTCVLVAGSGGYVEVEFLDGRREVVPRLALREIPGTTYWFATGSKQKN